VAFLELLAHEPRLERYRESEGGDFNRFLWEYYGKFHGTPDFQNIISLPVDKAFHPPEVYKQIIEERKRIGGEMVRGDYAAPGATDDPGLVMHLHMLWHLYAVPLSLPVEVVMCLDLALAKLLSVAHRRIGMDLTRAGREEPRTRSTTKRRSEKAANWKSFVMGIYEYGEPIKQGAKLSEVIRKIQRQFDQSRGNKEARWGEIPKDKSKFKTTKHDSITNLLKSQGILERDFENKGRYWLKKM
jgi:hypothetical protein